MKQKIVINIRKLFLRFIKEIAVPSAYYEKDSTMYKMVTNGIAPNTDFWEGARNKIEDLILKTSQPMSRYARTIYEKRTIKTIQYETENGFETKEINTFNRQHYSIIENILMNYFSVYFKIEPYRKEFHDRFIIFLKKHGAYKLYMNCVAPYYIEHSNTNIKDIRGYYDRTKNDYQLRTRITKELPNTYEQLNPKEYITMAFDWSHTIKPYEYWEKLNELWKEEFLKIQKKLLDNTVVIYD